MSHVAAPSSRGGETNNGGAETKVVAPANAPTATSSRGGDVNVPTFENRVVAP